MDDYRRQFEQRALKNARALLDNVERDDGTKISGRVMSILGAVMLGTVLALIALLEVSTWREKRNAERVKACVRDTTTTRMDEAERYVRGKFQGLTESQIEEIAIIAAREAAQAECEKHPR